MAARALAEVVVLTYEAMGLLPPGRHPRSYDPGRFWSGDDLELTGGAALGGEIAVDVPARPAAGDPHCGTNQDEPPP